MPDRQIRLFPALSMLILLGTVPHPSSGAGLAWEAKLSAGTGEPQMVRVVTTNRRFKIERLGEGKQYLVDLEKDELYLIDTKKRSYQKMKLAEIESAAQNARVQMQAALSKMQKELQNLPLDQRRLLEQMMGDRAQADAASGAKVVVRKTGQVKTIAGYRCEQYVAEAEGKPLLKACTTDAIAAFQDLRKDWASVQGRLGKMNPFGGGNLQEAYQHIQGFPLESEAAGTRAVVTKVEATTPAAAEFEVPAGFKLEPAPKLPVAPQ